MENIRFLTGSEDKFKEFISNISKDDRVALISHTDHDGIAAAKVVSQYVDYELLDFVNYEEINGDLIEKLKIKKITKVIFTDLSINDIECIRKIEEFAELLVIDHHLFDEDFNSNKTVFMNAQGYCATYLIYYLFSKIKENEDLDWLVACASIADWQFFKNTEFMTRIFQKYNEKFSDDEKEIKKNKFWDVQYKISLAIIYYKNKQKKIFDGIGKDFGELNDLDEGFKEVEDEIEKVLKDFEKEREVYNDIYLFEVKSKFSIKSIVSNILSSKEKNKTFILLHKNDKYFHVSVRRQDKKVNLPDLLEKLLIRLRDSDSGGHLAAAGGHFLVEDLGVFKKNLEKLG